MLLIVIISFIQYERNIKIHSHKRKIQQNSLKTSKALSDA